MKPSRRKRFGVAALCLALAALAVPACGGRYSGSDDGGESHFLHRCSSSCPGDLECISGVCTKGCIIGESSACGALAPAAVCTNESVEPGAVAICDVGCVGDGDCAALDGEHGCSDGYCRAPTVAPFGAGGGGAGGGGGEAAAAGSGGGSAGSAMTSGRGGTGNSGSGSGISTAGGAGGSSGGVAGATAGGGAVGSAGMAAQVCDPTPLITSDERNYDYSSALVLETQRVKPGSELIYDWSGVTHDLRGRPVDLTNVDMVETVLYERTVDEFATELNADTLGQPVVIFHFPVQAGQTSASLFEANTPGGPLEVTTILDYFDAGTYPPDQYMYAVMVAEGLDYGQGTFTLAAFQLDPSSTNTDVVIDDQSAHVSFSVSIRASTPTFVPPGVGGITVDWTKQKYTASGLVFEPASITRVRIGMYTETLLELEAGFNQVEELAEKMFETPVDVGRSINLERAQTKDGEAFAGIDTTHTWLLSLECGQCSNPAPSYLTVLAPCSAAP